MCDKGIQNLASRISLTKPMIEKLEFSSRMKQTSALKRTWTPKPGLVRACPEQVLHHVFAHSKYFPNHLISVDACLKISQTLHIFN